MNSIIQALLSFPFAFELFQKTIGDDSLKKKLIKEIIMPNSKSKILDMGCGTGSILDFLPENIEYVGYDSSQKYINAALRKYKKRGEFHCEEINNLVPSDRDRFDIVLAKGILHHIDDKESKKLFNIAFSSLKSGGCLITIDGVYVNNQSKIAKYIISKDRGQYIRTGEEYKNLAETYFSKIETYILDDAYIIPYTIFIMKCYKV